eukprot:6703203-Prymnesium_polylepis.2
MTKSTLSMKYLQGASSFKLPKGHVAVKVYCSEHNPGARELADEMNGIWPGLLLVADVQSGSDLGACDHMLVYLNALTWTHDPEPFAVAIREALLEGLHLQPCHEFPSVTDMGSERHALEFKQIMVSTPSDLRQWPTNIYSQIAISLKGGELRETGLSNLAERLAQREGRAVKATYGDAAAGSMPTRRDSRLGAPSLRNLRAAVNAALYSKFRQTLHNFSRRFSRNSQGRTSAVDNTPAASAEGVLTRESSV